MSQYIGYLLLLWNLRANLTYETFVVWRAFQLSYPSFELLEHLCLGGRFRRLRSAHVRIGVGRCTGRSDRHRVRGGIDFHRRSGLFRAVEEAEFISLKARRLQQR